LDHRSFDLLSRAVALGGTRRRLLSTLAGLTASGFAAGSRSVLADTSDDDGTGGSTVACVPRPGLLQTSDAAQAPFPAVIASGTCESQTTEGVAELFEVVPGGVTAEGVPVTGTPVGAAAGVAVSQSVTTIHTGLGDLLTTPHSVVVRAGENDDTVIACGDIGGLRNGDDLAIAIRDVSGAGWGGISWLRGEEGSTLVYLFLAPGLGSAVAVKPGMTVVTLDEVNLRATPSADGEVITILAKGVELEVTGNAQGDWIPVKEPSSGDEGYVAAQYLAAQ
jgi:hypothetical protein